MPAKEPVSAFENLVIVLLLAVLAALGLESLNRIVLLTPS